MSTDKPQSSFSPRRRWKIGFDLFARTILVFAVVVMANYIGAQFPQHLYLSSQTRIQLSSRTVVFYLTATFFFLFLTLRVVESRRWK